MFVDSIQNINSALPRKFFKDIGGHGMGRRVADCKTKKQHSKVTITPVVYKQPIKMRVHVKS